jgi:hypothetical protein
MRNALPLLLAVAACQPPPPAPEGLDDSTSFLIREFWSDDATFQAGIQGFMQWFEDEGKDLVGERATTENTEAFTVGDLQGDDVAHLPLNPQVQTESDGTSIARDTTLAKGVVSLAEMDCDWLRAEDLLIRADQDTIFPNDWAGYDREYATDVDVFTAASRSETFSAVRDTVTPFAAHEDGGFSGDFDPEAYGDTLMFTFNDADPTPVLVANLPAYPLDLHFRHGIYDIDGEPTGAFAILTFNRDAIWGSAGANALLQSYSMEINVQRPGDKTLRMLAVWAEPKGGGVSADSALALNYAVNKSLTSSETLSDICAGVIEVTE